MTTYDRFVRCMEKYKKIMNTEDPKLIDRTLMECLEAAIAYRDSLNSITRKKMKRNRDDKHIKYNIEVLEQLSDVIFMINDARARINEMQSK